MEQKGAEERTLNQGAELGDAVDIVQPDVTLVLDLVLDLVALPFSEGVGPRPQLGLELTRFSREFVSAAKADS
ncbi:MAG: hypothetical protein HRU17_07780 [Polyangiaceae bacterium]|nr:hypothetical protein [Polyangiaceae bacterium]